MEQSKLEAAIMAGIRIIERAVVLSLLGMMLVTIVISTVELGIIMYEQILAPPYLFLDIDNLLEIFGFFLMVLIGLELFETIRIYLEESTVHVELVMLVAIVAVSRKIIIIDYKEVEPMMNFSIAALVIALCAGYFLIKKMMQETRKPEVVASGEENRRNLP